MKKKKTAHKKVTTADSLKNLRKHAREKIENGAITFGYTGDRKKIIGWLNEALATEIVCVLRYRFHSYMVRGMNSEAISREFMEHSVEEQEHADRLAARIVQLGGVPDMNPSTLLERSHADYAETKNLLEMIKENLIAERIAIDSYREMIRLIGDTDSTTRRLLENILEMEEKHADDLVEFIQK